MKNQELSGQIIVSLDGIYGGKPLDAYLAYSGVCNFGKIAKLGPEFFTKEFEWIPKGIRSILGCKVFYVANEFDVDYLIEEVLTNNEINFVSVSSSLGKKSLSKLILYRGEKKIFVDLYPGDGELYSRSNPVRGNFSHILHFLNEAGYDGVTCSPGVLKLARKFFVPEKFGDLTIVAKKVSGYTTETNQRLITPEGAKKLGATMFVLEGLFHSRPCTSPAEEIREDILTRIETGREKAVA